MVVRGFNDNQSRMLRGGSWLSKPDQCRSGFRGWGSPDYRNYVIGFRVVCVGAAA